MIAFGELLHGRWSETRLLTDVSGLSTGLSNWVVTVNEGKRVTVGWKKERQESLTCATGFKVITRGARKWSAGAHSLSK